MVATFVADVVAFVAVESMFVGVGTVSLQVVAMFVGVGTVYVQTLMLGAIQRLATGNVFSYKIDYVLHARPSDAGVHRQDPWNSGWENADARGCRTLGTRLVGAPRADETVDVGDRERVIGHIEAVSGTGRTVRGDIASAFVAVRTVLGDVVSVVVVVRTVLGDFAWASVAVRTVLGDFAWARVAVRTVIENALMAS